MIDNCDNHSQTSVRCLDSTAQTLAPNDVTRARWPPPERRYCGFTFAQRQEVKWRHVVHIDIQSMIIDKKTFAQYCTKRKMEYKRSYTHRI